MCSSDLTVFQILQEDIKNSDAIKKILNVIKQNIDSKYLEEIKELEELFTNPKILQELKKEKEDELKFNLKLIYKYRNRIVHNATYNSCILEILSNIVKVYLRNIINIILKEIVNNPEVTINEIFYNNLNLFNDLNYDLNSKNKSLESFYELINLN